MATTPAITVLGASGLVGSAVAARLARRPGRLRLVARDPVGLPSGTAADVDIVASDLRDRAALTASVDGADVIVFALPDPRDDVDLGLAVLRDLLDVVGSAARPPLVLYPGAASQVGLASGRPVDGSEPDAPITTRDLQKSAAEQLLKQATSAGVVRGVSLRLPIVFGEGAVAGATDRGLVGGAVRRAVGGEPIMTWYGEQVRRDLMHVSDVATAFAAAIDHPGELVGRHWPVGSGHGSLLGDVFHRIAEIVATRTGTEPVPVTRIEPPPGTTVADQLSLTVDPARFQAATGWQPQVSLSSGLSRTVAAIEAEAQSRPAQCHIEQLRSVTG